MDLKSYLKGKSRREFAEKIGTSLNYINNLCQRPSQAGKNIALRIEQATGGAVTRMELLYPEKEAGNQCVHSHTKTQEGDATARPSTYPSPPSLNL